MDRSSDRDRSSRRSDRDRGRDRDSGKDHHRDRDRDRDFGKHRHHHGGDSDKRHRDDDRGHLSRTDSPEPRRERSSSRARDSVERDRDRAGFREDSVERRDHRSSARKRKGYGEEDEQDLDRKEKRARVSDRGREEKREGRRFEDDLNGIYKEERKEEKRSKDGKKDEESRGAEVDREEKRTKEEVLSDVDDKKGRKEGRRFSDKAEKKDVSEGKALERKEGRDDQLVNGGQSNGAVEKSDSKSNESLAKSSKVSVTSPGSHHPLPTKVSSITTTNENEGVSIRSDEVHGKSSTDGTATSVAGKSGSLSLDALAKAKKALQMQKELSEKLKKIPMLNKLASSSTDNYQLTSNKDGPKVPPSGVGAQSGSSASATPVQAMPRLPVGGTLSQKPSAAGVLGVPPGFASVHNIEAVKRAQELAAKMGFRQDPEFAPLINMFPVQSVTEVAAPQRPAKAPVLRLDAQGREIDEHGNVINVTKPTNLSTLKVNINKQKKEAFQILKPDLDASAELNPHFDSRMGINKTKLLRPKRMSFQFVEEGKWSKQAEIIKFKSQFGEAQAKELKLKQSQLAKAKAEPDSNPNLIAVGVRVPSKEKQKEEIPIIEWWDKPILPSGSYDDIAEEKFNLEKITIYVEHPLPIEPPAEPAPPPPQPLKLTKKEQKKLRTQRRLAKERDRQEMIRQGLLEPPKAKIKMSNLMKVLGSEATQDPTRLEMEIRSAAAEREQAHVDRNIARKLTPAERREKKERKLFEDPSTLETYVSVYKIKDLSHPQTRFKVDVNAQENRLTGCAVIADGVSVVVVEGGRKPIKRYGKLMLKRINWAAAVNEDEGAEDTDLPANSCVLVWQGTVAKPSFNRFLVHQCRSEAAARKVFADGGVPHYWELAVNFSEELM